MGFVTINTTSGYRMFVPFYEEWSYPPADSRPLYPSPCETVAWDGFLSQSVILTVQQSTRKALCMLVCAWRTTVWTRPLETVGFYGSISFFAYFIENEPRTRWPCFQRSSPFHNPLHWIFQIRHMLGDMSENIWWAVLLRITNNVQELFFFFYCLFSPHTKNNGLKF